MAKDKNRGSNMSVVEKPAAEQAQVETPAAGSAAEATLAVGPNYTLVYRRDHPQDRCSYGIAGVSGIVVFDKGLFANGVPPTTITVDCALAQPKADAKAEKARLAAERAQDRATKAAVKIEAAQARAAEKSAKAAEALAKAQAKVAAAQAQAGGGSTDAVAAS